MHLKSKLEISAQTDIQTEPMRLSKCQHIPACFILVSDSLSPTSLKNYSKQDKTHILPIFSTHLFDENYTLECGILLLFYGSL